MVNVVETISGPVEVTARYVVENFPDVFERARVDWAKYKLGVEAGLFETYQRARIEDWFGRLPVTWEGIRPNWTEPDLVTGMLSTHKVAFAEEVDNWLDQFKPGGSAQLGGWVIAVAVAGGVMVALGSVVWLVTQSAADYQEQENISAMIEAETAGNLPSGTVKAAVERETGSGGIFAGIGEGIDTITNLGIGAVVFYLIGPQIQTMANKLLKKVKA